MQPRDCVRFSRFASMLLFGMFSTVVACTANIERSQPEETRTVSQPLGTCGLQNLPIAGALASSEQSNAFSAANAVDGKLTTRWSSNVGAPQWLRLDLGQRRFVSSVTIDWEIAFSPNFDVQASDNGVNFAPVRRFVGATGGHQVVTGLDLSARYIRIYANQMSGYGSVSILEVHISGDPSPACGALAAHCGDSVQLGVQTAQASSTEASYTPASAAVDNVYSTRWSSAFADNQWLAIDLGASARVDKVRVTWENAFARVYAIETGPSLSGPWTTVATNSSGQGLVETLSINATTRYLRLNAIQRATGYGFSVWEFSVYGSSGACACGGHGTVDPSTGTCVCDLGAAGTACQSCAAGFVLDSTGSRCVLANDGCVGPTTMWPNACSKANSDPWLVVHHDDVQQVKPTVLVLLYANPGTFAGETGLVTAVANGFAEGSRTQGFKNASATPQIQYQTHVADLRDGVNGRPPPPPGYAFQNSTLFPRSGPPQPGAPGGTMDYAKLFTSGYAPNYGYADPAHPGEFLDLCTLVNQGTIHEVWLVGSADVPDVAGGLEVLGMSPVYTRTGNLIPGSVNRCANGCAAPDVPFCGRSLRIGFVNYTRGPGCFLHSQGHDIEFGIQNSVPTLAEWLSPYERFDLNTTYGLPFSNLYALSCSTPPCLTFPSPTHVHFTFGTTPIDVDPYDPICGNVHFPPNGTSNYDYFDTTTVSTSCTGFGRHAGPGGTDAKALLGGSVAALPWSTPVNAQYPDCGGEYLVWWYQNMPGHASQQTFSDGRTMKSIWPYLFY